MKFRVLSKSIFKADYTLLSKVLFLIGVIGPPAFMIFYYTCRYQGFWDNFIMRLLTALSCLPLIYFGRLRRLPRVTWHYFEFFLLFILPFHFAYFFLHNHTSSYWFVSFVWAGIIYGASTGLLFNALILFPIGTFLAFAYYHFETGSTSEVLFQGIGGFSVAWLSAIIFGVIRIGANRFYQLQLEHNALRIRNEETLRNQKILEEKNLELVARNAIISTFVRPSLLEEIKSGKDPRDFRPRIVDKAIMICDMRNFTPLTSSMLKAEEQAQFINRYFEMMIEPVFECGGEVDKLMGDAIMAIFPDGQTAINASLKMRTLLHDYNSKLFADKEKKIANVVSLSKGMILEANIGAQRKLDRTWIGAAVNICARLESVAKTYGIEVIASQDIIGDVSNYANVRMIDIIKVKGYARKFEVYEVYGHQPQEVIDFKNSTKGNLRDAIQLYFTKGKIQEACAAFNNLMQSMPPHRFDNKQSMDNIILYYDYRCSKLLSEDGKGLAGYDLVEGCHDFSSELLPTDWYNIPRIEARDRLSKLIEKR